MSKVLAHFNFASVTTLNVYALQINSVSLVHTATAIAFNDNVQTVLISSMIFSDILSPTISGWGSSTVNGKNDPNNLQRQTTRTMSNKECSSKQIPHSELLLTENKLFTANDVGRGTCYGDQGGPLVINGNELIGIASWQKPCGTGTPDVDERVAPHRLWIMGYII